MRRTKMYPPERKRIQDAVQKLQPYSNRWAVKVRTLSDENLLAIYTEHHPYPFAKEVEEE